MKTVKRIPAQLFAAAMLLPLLAGCAGAPDASGTPSPSTSNEPSPAPSETTPAAQSSQTGTDAGTGVGKILVAYYSASGNTRAVAEYIQSALGADIFEITPAEVYTSADLNWTDDNSRVSREHDDPALRTMELVSTQVEGWEDYDTVFIGYPIWWGITAWPVDNFVSANDFTGKTVIPFCTSSSSGLGQSGELLAELAGTGDWQEGRRFRSGVSEADVTDWTDSLGLSA